MKPNRSNSVFTDNKKIFQFNRAQLNKIFLVFLIIATVFSAACQTKETSDTLENFVVVKAPSDGVVIKVFVNDGAKIGKDAPIVESVTNGETLNVPPENGQSKPDAATIWNAQKEVDAAQNLVEPTSVEIQRIKSLVASNSAPQAQLDAAEPIFKRRMMKNCTPEKNVKKPRNSDADRKIARRVLPSAEL